jgi:hypothetical protein
MKKETVDSKLAEIEKQSQVVALEAKIAAIDEMIETKNQRISMISEDENLSELVDKAKMKVMQREVKDLERRKAKIEKLYEKMCGKSYTKEEIVDEEMSTELNENKTKMKKSELKEMIKAAMMSEVNIDIQDTNADYDFLAEEYEATDHDIQIGPAMAGMVNIRKYLEKSAPEYLNDLKAIDSVLTSYDNKMAYGDDDLGVPGDNALGLEEAEATEVFTDAELDMASEMLMDMFDKLGLENNVEKSDALVKYINGWFETNDFVNEAKEEVEDEEVDVTDGEEEVETTDVETTTEVDPNVKAVQDALTAAQAAAADLGDEKLTDQIGNTITFFTRQHVANIDSMNEMDVQDAADDTETKIDSVAAAEIGMEENLNESMFPMLKKILR